MGNSDHFFLWMIFIILQGGGEETLQFSGIACHLVDSDTCLKTKTGRSELERRKYSRKTQVPVAYQNVYFMPFLLTLGSRQSPSFHQIKAFHLGAKKPSFLGKC